MHIGSKLKLISFLLPTLLVMHPVISQPPQQCPITPSLRHIVIELNDDDHSHPLRQQVIEPRGIIIWHQDPRRRQNLVSIEIVKKKTGLSPNVEIQPCTLEADPRVGRCEIRTDIVDAAHPTEIFEYKYCSTNENSLPTPADCHGRSAIKTHTLRIRLQGSDPVDSGFSLGNIDLVLPANTEEVHHFIPDINACVHWRNWKRNVAGNWVEEATRITFGSPPPAIKSNCYPNPTTTGVESCSIPARPPHTAYDRVDYSLCIGANCDPTIHILGSGETFQYFTYYKWEKYLHTITITSLAPLFSAAQVSEPELDRKPD